MNTIAPSRGEEKAGRSISLKANAQSLPGINLKQPAANPFTRAALGLALSAHRAGKLQEAEAQYLRVLKIAPAEFDALAMLGTLLCQRKDLVQGLEYLKRANRLRPQSLNVLLNMGLCLQALGEHRQALATLEKGHRQDPGSLAFLRGRASSHFHLQQYESALTCHERMEKLAPSPGYDLINHGLALYELGRFNEALEKLTAAKPSVSGDHSLFYNLARCLMKLGRHEEAIAGFQNSLSLKPDDTKSLIGGAEAARAMNDSKSALAFIQSLLGREPRNPFALAFKASLLLDLGKRNEAADIFRSLLEQDQQIGEAAYGLSHCKAFTELDSDAHLIIRCQALPDLNAAEGSLVNFGASKCFDDTRHYDEAFRAAVTARNLQPPAQAPPYDFEAIKSIFSRERLQEFSFKGNPSSQPVFVVGMPRSGTSLIEQIIASHSQADGAGELEDFLRLAKANGLLELNPKAARVRVDGWDPVILQNLTDEYLKMLTRGRAEARRIVDKMPHNFLLLGLIAVVFPNAKIVHVQRDALDTCLSIFLNRLAGMHDYANDLASLGEHYNQYLDIMAHWQELLGDRIYSCRYESLVGNPELEIARLLGHLDLPWEDGCLRFFELDRTVTTFSRGQVRQPLYTRSIGRWRNYEKNLSTLRTKLAQRQD